jgi:hypothetical protein
MKSLRIIVCVCTMAILTACGGSGGSGGAGNTADPSSGDGSGGGGSPSGGDGSAAYYGFSTDSASAITNQINPLSSGSNQMTIPSQVSFNLRNLNDRLLDVMIYQPTCILGLLTETYSAVLISGANTSATIASITISSSGILFQERAILAGVQVYDYGSSVSVAGTCSNGVMNLGSSGSLFSNGKLMIWRTGAGDLYLGGRSTLIETVMANFQLKQYDKYEQVDNGSVNPSNALSNWLSGNAGQVVSDASASSSHSSFNNSGGNTIVKGFRSNTPNSRYAANSNGYSTSTTQHTRVWSNLSSDVPFYGFGISNLGSSGKAISVTAMKKVNGSTVTANDGSTSVELIKGSGAILIHLQK